MTIADKLQKVLDYKNAIKDSLEVKGKEPTESLGTYAGLINELDNEEQVSYVLTNANGTKKVFAQLSSKDPITLTATENDIRQNTSAITNTGYTEGTKEIPSYYSSYGYKFVLAGKEATLVIHEADYKNLMVTIAPYNSSAENSVAIKYASVDNSMYETNSTSKISNITKDTENEEIKLGVTVSEKSVLRYFVVREEV